ncbi:MAG: hypothetical protein ACM3SP_12615 [Chloroflexota bacterium]
MLFQAEREPIKNNDAARQTKSASGTGNSKSKTVQAVQSLCSVQSILPMNTNTFTLLDDRWSEAIALAV